MNGDGDPPSEPVAFPLWPGWSPPKALATEPVAERSPEPIDDPVPELEPAPLPEPELGTDVLPDVPDVDGHRFERLRAALVLVVLVVSSAIAAALAVGVGIALVALAVRRAVG